MYSFLIISFINFNSFIKNLRKCFYYYIIIHNKNFFLQIKKFLVFNEASKIYLCEILFLNIFITLIIVISIIR